MKLEFVHLVGMALIAFGLAAIDGRLWRCGKPLELRTTNLSTAPGGL